MHRHDLTPLESLFRALFLEVTARIHSLHARKFHSGYTALWPYMIYPHLMIPVFVHVLANNMSDNYILKCYYLEAQTLWLNSKRRTCSIGGDRITSYIHVSSHYKLTEPPGLAPYGRICFPDLKILNPDLVLNCSSVVDISFENVQGIALTLARYEELFKYESYRQSTHRPPGYVSDTRGYTWVVPSLANQTQLPQPRVSCVILRAIRAEVVWVWLARLGTLAWPERRSGHVELTRGYVSL